ncbi:family 1 putative glycosyltransferase [Podospora fimiseda]|uniref:Family 1 putative glycosyltransferase n=1 Tax=Podospora fimiseda TaxID=252190 RepID=A0AAN7BZM5_9PEZI|nr:family 1 putative glycosyltransferase [Podospora fimiseda]
MASVPTQQGPPPHTNGGPPPGVNGGGPPPWALNGTGPPPGVNGGGPPPFTTGPPLPIPSFPPPNTSLPHILILCTSSTAPGHVLPLTTIAHHLRSIGHAVTFVGGIHHRNLIESSGASFLPTHDSISLAKGPFRQWGMERAKYPEGLPRMVQDFKTFFIGQIEGQFLSTKSALEHLHSQNKDQQVIIINETMWFGYLPYKWGASPPSGWEQDEEMPKTIGINVTPIMLDGEDFPPFPLGLLPGTTAETKERDSILKEWLYKYVVKEAYDGFRENIKQCGGVNVPDEWMVNLSYTAHDVTLQLCDPVLEYPRPDLPKHVKFAGSLPPKKGREGGAFKFPGWWKEEVVENKEKKSLVVVSQGTLARDYTMLLKPTIKALAGRKDVLVVALLGKQGAEVPDGILPEEGEGVDDVSNVRVVDFIPYDAVLEYADVMISNAGYGGFIHCVVNGVPLIAAGLSEDKCEVSTRVEWTGAGINLRTGRPTPEAVAAAVDTILSSGGKYRARAKELAVQVAKGNPLEVVEREVRALTKGRI